MFDNVICVDWSAAAVPRTGADSIWVATLSCRRPGHIDLRNIETRQAAADALFNDFTAAVAAGRRVLAGVDFPLGFPTGFVEKAKIGVQGPPWLRLWRHLSEVISDGPSNANNRFDVAADLNRRLGEPVFWGCPKAVASDSLPMRKPRPWPAALAEYRICERHAPGRPQPVWKLAYTGSVGSQALTGIPILERLRRHAALRPYTRAWPFETSDLAWADLPRPLILMAEVYPSLFEGAEQDHPVKDARQVMAAARALARLQAGGGLAPALTLPGLVGADRHAVHGEEGWILGV